MNLILKELGSNYLSKIQFTNILTPSLEHQRRFTSIPYSEIYIPMMHIINCQPHKYFLDLTNFSMLKNAILEFLTDKWESNIKETGPSSSALDV